jgi:hypothetical protein
MCNGRHGSNFTCRGEYIPANTMTMLTEELYKHSPEKLDLWKTDKHILLHALSIPSNHEYAAQNA